MNADLLRRAAKTLLAHADNTMGPAPWRYVQDPDGTEGIEAGDANDDDHGLMVYSHYTSDDGIALGDADGLYIALMHPPVALALAAWLDAAATDLDIAMFGENAVDRAAVATARAILREPAS